MKPYYDADGITIYHGDCMEVLPTLEKASLILTDPPYGVNMDKGFGGSVGFGGLGAPIARRVYAADNWDSDRPDKKLIVMLPSFGEVVIIWGGNFFADILPRSTHWIFWDKLQTMPTFGDGELAWTNSPRKSIKKITVEWNGLIGKEKTRVHPTQKPIKLMKICILEYGTVGDFVLDPFMGSGTTLLAAKELGRRATGIEIEEKYCEIAAKRLAQGILL